MNEKILGMANQYEDDSFFTHAGFTDEARAVAERDLNLVLPEQYFEYLKAFGHGGVGGVEVLGVGCDGGLIFVENTLFYRKYGLPLNLVVIENHDEWLACVDCETGKIVTWSQGGEVPLNTTALMTMSSKSFERRSTICGLYRSCCKRVIGQKALRV